MCRIRIIFYELTLLTSLYLTLLVGCRSEVLYEGKKYVRQDWPFTITCKKSPYGGPPKWTKDGISLEPNEGNHYIIGDVEHHHGIDIKRLHVNSAQLRDKGEYKCDTMSDKFHRIELIPTEETEETGRPPDTVLLRTNETLELFCAEVDSDINDVNWYKDGHSIIETERIEISGTRRRTLIVKNATEEDSGDYLCSTAGSTLSYPVAGGHVIQVTYGARVEGFQSQIRPIFGRNFSLECKVHGYPVPRVTWFIDNVPGDTFVQNHSRMSILDNKEGLPDSVLFIRDVTYDDDHNVKCKARNFQGSTETVVSLAVMENMISTNEKLPGKGIVLTPGSELVLRCNTTDDPDMNVKWYKNGNPINTTDERIDLKTHNTLRIEKAAEADTGSYVCETSDGDVNVTIFVRTEIKIYPFDHSRNIVEGQNIVLTCNVTQGIPLPTLQWFKDGELLNLSDSRISTESNRGIESVKLTIKEAEFDDRAEYMCLATNDYGSENASILVRVKDKYAALWPFLGICAEVAILCTIIFIYEKKRQKPDYDESEADHNTENKTVPDQEDKSQDVRQRK